MICRIQHGDPVDEFWHGLLGKSSGSGLFEGAEPQSAGTISGHSPAVDLSAYATGLSMALQRKPLVL